MPFAVNDFERRHCYDRFWVRLAGGSAGRRYLSCGEAFVLVGSGRRTYFHHPGGSLLEHFRHQYFLLFLLPHLPAQGGPADGGRPPRLRPSSAWTSTIPIRSSAWASARSARCGRSSCASPTATGFITSPTRPCRRTCSAWKRISWAPRALQRVRRRIEDMSEYLESGLAAPPGQHRRAPHRRRPSASSALSSPATSA